MNPGVAGGSSQQPHELALGRLQGAVRHIVDESDREHRVSGVLPATEFRELAQLRRCETGAYDQPMFVEQDGHAAVDYSAA
jgi:hypothetical protein